MSCNSQNFSQTNLNVSVDIVCHCNIFLMTYLASDVSISFSLGSINRHPVCGSVSCPSLSNCHGSYIYLKKFLLCKVLCHVNLDHFCKVPTLCQKIEKYKCRNMELFIYYNIKIYNILISSSSRIQLCDCNNAS